MWQHSNFEKLRRSVTTVLNSSFMPISFAFLLVLLLALSVAAAAAAAARLCAKGVLSAHAHEGKYLCCDAACGKHGCAPQRCLSRWDKWGKRHCCAATIMKHNQECFGEEDTGCFIGSSAAQRKGVVPPPFNKSSIINHQSSTSRNDEVCYSSPRSRFAPLQGAWAARNNSSAAPPYWNLSCPLEWSKYSCVHQGSEAHALASRALSFEPTDCILPSIHHRLLPRGRRTVFLGDSLIRQVAIALACHLSAGIERYDVKWPRCGIKSKEWPCHSQANCVKCGPHSGFHGAYVHLLGGSTIVYQTQIRAKALRPSDILVVEAGVHGDLNAAIQGQIHFIEALGTFLSEKNGTVIWLVTPPEAFPSSSGNGNYDATFLASQRESSRASGHIYSPGCEASVPPWRSEGEWRELHGHRGGILPSSMLAGVVELAGLNHQGHAKVGGGVGSFGDCQHYCMPGVPDLMARAVFAMLVAIK